MGLLRGMFGGDDWELRCNRTIAKEFFSVAAEKLARFSLSELDVSISERLELTTLARRLDKLSHKWPLTKPKN